jgi:hypothetical protein
MICCSGIGEKDDNRKKSEVLSNILLASSQNRISNCQLVGSTQLNPAACGCRIKRFPTIPQFAVSRSNVVGLYTEITTYIQQPRSHD